jgi:TRAP-type C4-dicarboxylate transport system permease small subunit
LLQRLPEKIQLFHEVFLLSTALFISAFMGFYCAHMVWESYLFEEITHGYIPIPLWVPQLPVALGLIGLNFAIIDNLILALSGKEPAYKTCEREVN